MSMLSRSAGLAALVLVLAACSNAGTSGSPPGTTATPNPPSAPPSSSAGAVGAIQHKTGATDVVLRVDEGGGMMMASYTAANAPAFTLFGDGTLVFRNVRSGEPIPAIGSVMPLLPFRTAKMSEDQIQTLLAFALGQGGLGAA